VEDVEVVEHLVAVPAAVDEYVAVAHHGRAVGAPGRRSCACRAVATRWWVAVVR
jgi:hypothetical protein